MKFVSSSMNGRKYIVTPFAGVWIEIICFKGISHLLPVTPFAGVWIEIFLRFCSRPNHPVTPFAGVWIEISDIVSQIAKHGVTPFAGVWIEIAMALFVPIKRLVTPFAGVWIEIYNYTVKLQVRRSLPSRECGLKFHFPIALSPVICHSLRGSVD